MNKKLKYFIGKIQEEKTNKLNAYFEFLGFSNNSKAVCLIHLLRSNRSISRDYVLQLFYPSEDRSLKKVQEIENKAIFLLENFLAQRSILKSQSLKQEKLLEEIKTDAPLNILEKYLKRFEKNFDSSLNYLQIADDCFERSPFKMKDPLQEHNDTLDEQYQLAKIKIALKANNRNRAFNTAYTINHLDDVLNYSCTSTLNQFYIQLYHYFLNDHDFKALKEFCQKVISKKELIELKEVKTLLEYAVNLCIRKINSGKDDYYQLLFDIYQTMLEMKVLHENGQLSHTRLKNIITIGRRLKQYQKCKRLLNLYVKDLDENIQEAAYTYNMASILSKEGQFQEAIYQLYNVEFLDTTYNLDARSIQLICYYELCDVESFEHAHNAFRWYLMRNKKIDTKTKSGYMNLLKITKPLFQLKTKIKASNQGKDDLKVEKLQNRLQKFHFIMNKVWLEEKLLELI